MSAPVHSLPFKKRKLTMEDNSNETKNHEPNPPPKKARIARTMTMTPYEEYPEFFREALGNRFETSTRTAVNGEPLFRHVYVQGGNKRLEGHTGFVCQRMFKGEKSLRRLALTKDTRVAALAAVASELDESIQTQDNMTKWLHRMTSSEEAQDWILRYMS